MATGISRRQPMVTTDFGHRREDLPPAGPDGVIERLDLRSWFPEPLRHLPLELELGSGRGTFLAQQAPLELNKIFLGIEWASPYYRFAADRARRLKLLNVQMLRDDGPEFIRQRLADKTVSQFHWYFPDPWPKPKQKKRRTFQEGFLRDLHRVLVDPVPGTDDTGTIRVVTDHRDYWSWMEDHAARVTDIYERLPYVPPTSAKPGEWVGSNFERKYVIEGRIFTGMILRKRV